MGQNKRPEPMSGADVVRRTPRVFTYLATVLDAKTSGDVAHEVEAPSDLPLDEATFTCMVVLMADLAEALGMTGDDMRAMATRGQEAVDNLPPEPDGYVETADGPVPVVLVGDDDE